MPSTSSGGTAGKLTLMSVSRGQRDAVKRRITSGACAPAVAHGILRRSAYCWLKAMAGTSSSVASIAAATVPEYVTSSPRLAPALMPDSISVGRLSRMSTLMASSTQSVGVPSTAYRRTPRRRTRRGRSRVSEWLAPLCSRSGATTQTSRQSPRAILARSLRPGALMPSSLETRMRADARSMPASGIAADDLDPAHIGLQRIRHGDGAVGALIVLQHGNQGAADRKAGAVQGMDEAHALPFLRPEARLHAPRLELAAIGAARYLAIGVLPGQPDLEIIGLARGEAHIARTEQHDA